MAAGRSMDETPVFGQNQRWDNYVTRWEWNEKGEYQLARLFGNVVMDFVHYVATKNGKFYPEFCHGWDVDNCVFYPDREARCPCCALQIKGQYRYFMNSIDIEAEENKPSKPKADWSPIRFIDLSVTLFQRVKELKTVNKGYNVADGAHGAIIQIKYNSNLDPGSQYAATMDTKDVGITDEQKEYIVTQKYPDGSSKIIRGANGLPAQFDYIRCINSRDEMIKSLKRHNYYGEQNSSAGHSFDLNQDEMVAKIDAESPIETMDLSNIFPSTPMVDEDPAPKKVLKKEVYDECPTEFGKFASTLDCFTNCGLRDECREATNSKTDKTSVKPTTVKKEVAPVEEDDDDTV
jgi:hypothetical protein